MPVRPGDTNRVLAALRYLDNEGQPMAYFAVTNLIEIFIEMAVTPRLIRRLGVASANLIHPGMMLASFGGLAVSFGMQPLPARASIARS